MICPSCQNSYRSRGLRNHFLHSPACQRKLQEEGKIIGQEMAKLGSVAIQEREIGGLAYRYLVWYYTVYLIGDNVVAVSSSSNTSSNYRAEETDMVIYTDADDENWDLDDGDNEDECLNTSDNEDDGASDHDMENYLEPYRPLVSYGGDEYDKYNYHDQDDDSTVTSTKTVYDASCPLHQSLTVRKFPGKAGKIYSVENTGNEEYEEMVGILENVYAPFSSKLEWEIAKWAKLQGTTSTAFSDMMKIEDVSWYQAHVLKLYSYQNITLN
jgi:hypothetical protein